MHPSSMNNMQICIDKYIDKNKCKVMLDVGGRGLNSDRSYKKLFKGLFNKYYIADILEGDNVTHVMPDPFTLPFEDNTFDVIVSGQTLEHVANPFKLVTEMKRVLKEGGRMIIIAPSTGPRHDQQDGWRFLDDAFRFIAEDTGLKIIADWIDKNAPDQRSRRWSDHVFVGEK